jgi:hypothetical protein
MRYSRIAAGTALATLALLQAQAAQAQDAPGYFKVPGTETTLKFYGYVQLDATYDVSGRIGDIENYDYASIVAVQPLNGSANAKETGKTYLTARTSRFGIQSSTPTEHGPLATKLEGDFNAPNGYQGQTFSNSYAFRLRHAYGTLGALLVGQTWTQFLDLASAPDTVDFNGPGSLALVRQPQVRYTFGLAEGSTLGLALENSRNGGVGHLPDVTAKLATGGSWGTAGLGVVTNQYRYSKASSSTPRSGTKQGYGVALSGSAKLGADTLVGLVAGGDGIGRYLFNTAAGQFTGTDADGNLKLWRVVGYHVGYTHAWSGAFRSNLVWSQTFFVKNGIAVPDGPVADDEGTGSFAANKRIDQAFVNTFWGFAKNAEVGLEYEYGRRKTFDGQTGKEDRITSTVHYSFF